jgi:hypothetical protein
MNRALAQLAYLKTKYPRGVDRVGLILKDALGEQHAILFVARMDRALALMNGFTGATMEDLRAFESAKQERCRRMIGDCAGAAPASPLSRTAFDIVPALTPNAFVVHVQADDSYAIGLDDALYDSFTVLTLAALAAFSNKDIEIYKRYCFHVFGLFYGSPHPSIIDDFEQLAAMYTGSAAPIKLMIDDMREMSVRFILAHEAAHIALTHFRSRHAEVVGFKPDVQGSQVSAFDDHACEFDADAWSAKHLFQLTRNDPRRQLASVQMPPLIMSFLHHIGTLGEGMAILGQVMRAKHPPEQERRARLRDKASAYNAMHDVKVDLILQIGDFIAELDSPLPRRLRDSLKGSVRS